jgi:hypothetical protein
VMDEKMKDTVKITVIATGFREVSRAGVNRAGANLTGVNLAHQWQAEEHHSFAASHDDAMDFPDPVGPAEPMPSPFPEPGLIMEESGMEEPSAVAMAQATSRAGVEVISLDSMRTAMVANFEQNDLDVPAFLRKRGEVM